MTNDKERERFEKWLLDEQGIISPPWESARNCYAEFNTHIAWKAWCANLPDGESVRVPQPNYDYAQAKAYADEMGLQTKFVAPSAPEAASATESAAQQVPVNEAVEQDVSARQKCERTELPVVAATPQSVGLRNAQVISNGDGSFGVKGDPVASADATPETDAVIRDGREDDRKHALDDLGHYMASAGRLAELASKLEKERDALARQVEKVTRARDCWKQSSELTNLLTMQKRAEAAESSERAIRVLMDSYNLGGWTDAEGAMKRALEAESALAALRKTLEDAGKELPPISRIYPGEPRPFAGVVEADVYVDLHAKATALIAARASGAEGVKK